MKLRRAGIVVAIVAYIAFGLSRLTLNINILDLLPQDLRDVQGVSLFLRHFALPDELIVTVEGGDAGTAAESLTQALRERPDIASGVVSQPPWLADPAGLSELVAYALINQKPAAFQKTTAALDASRAPDVLAETLERLGNSLSPEEIARLGYDPFGLADAALASIGPPETGASEFRSADGKFRVLYVKAPSQPRSYRDIIAWVDGVKASSREWAAKQPSGLALGFTGEPAFVAEISASMERDMATCGLVTLLIVSIIVWLAYRRIRPLWAIWQMLFTVFLLTLATAGLLFGELTMISVGFASILIGLSVDYGFLIYEEAIARPSPPAALRRRVAPSIVWAALTTAVVFAALNISRLPGLAELGTLVALGVVFGAAMMLTVFATRVTRPEFQPAAPVVELGGKAPRFLPVAIALGMGALAAVPLLRGLPPVDATSNVLRPRDSQAYDALDRLTTRLGQPADTLMLIVRGRDTREVGERLYEAESTLREAGEIASFQSIARLWPAEWQTTNLEEFEQLDLPALDRAAEEAGFAPESLDLTRAVFAHWTRWRGEKLPVWPEGDLAKWLFRRIAAREDAEVFAMTSVTPAPGVDPAQADSLAAFRTGDVFLTSWDQLGRSLTETVPPDMMRLAAALAAALLLMLVLAFRNARDVLLTLGVVGFSFAALLGAMRLLGIAWNLFDLAAVFLLLGAGVDYSIHMLFALRRDGREGGRRLRKVLLLCGGSTVAGFGSLSWAGNLGLSSLGQVCALGILFNMLAAAYLLPAVHQRLTRRR